MSFDVKIEKMIARPASEVFRAIAEGRLFMNCSADSRSIKIDFRVGGQYRLEFKNHGVSNFGEFIEIVPNKKIVFSWCQTFGPEQRPDTRVVIELHADGPKTRLVLVHSGFKDAATRDDHRKGWNGGLTDLDDEMVNGRLRMVRSFGVPVERLFLSCQNAETFFGHMGDLDRGSVDFRVGGRYQLPTRKGEIKGQFVEIEKNKKIAFTWLSGCGGSLDSSQVTLTFSSREKGSTLELTHTGLLSAEDQRAHREGWDFVVDEIQEAPEIAASF